MCLSALVSNAALTCQPLRVGEGDACEPCAEASGIDTEDQSSRVVVIIVFLVKCRGYCEDIITAAAEGIHDADVLGKPAPELHIPVELNYPVGKCLHLFILPVQTSG